MSKVDGMNSIYKRHMYFGAGFTRMKSQSEIVYLIDGLRLMSGLTGAQNAEQAQSA
jgi:hypothetical protein